MPEGIKNGLIFLISTLLCYALAEAGYSYAYRHGYVDPVRDGWFFEEAGKTIRFDPLTGYRLTPHPSRNLRISEGRVEYEGVFRGNNQGFQDRDDFWPARPAGVALRVAVLGDSFSSGQFLSVNWPDRVEDLAKTDGQALQLLNFSLYSGGLVNWRNILLGVIEKEQYALDMLVIPVYANDLFRPFMVFEARDTRMLLIGQAGEDVSRLPSTLEQALACCLKESEGYILTAEEYRWLKTSRWHPELPRPDKPYLAEHVGALYLFAREKYRLWLAGHESAQMPILMTAGSYSPDPLLGRGRFKPAQLQLIDEIRGYQNRSGVKVIVVRIPDRDELLNQAPVAGNVQEFAERLGVPLLDGMQAFGGLDAVQQQKQYFPYDDHWNQEGSDRFARFMMNYLSKPHYEAPIKSGAVSAY